MTMSTMSWSGNLQEIVSQCEVEMLGCCSGIRGRLLSATQEVKTRRSVDFVVPRSDHGSVDTARFPRSCHLRLSIKAGLTLPLSNLPGNLACWVRLVDFLSNVFGGSSVLLYASVCVY